MLKLIREDTPQATTHTFGAGTVRIGRVAGNELELPVSHVSSRHACIRYQGGRYLLSDLGSTNGSVVVRQGRRMLLGPKGEAEIALEADDLLLLGDIENPIRLRVARLEASADGAATGGTVVATRSRVRTTELARRVTDDHAALRVLFGLLQQINAIGDREQLLQRIAAATIETVPGAVDALLVLHDEGRLTVRAQAHRGEGICREANQQLCQRVLDSGEALLFGDANAGAPAATLGAQGVGSGIVAPLFRDQQVAGVLQVNCLAGRHDLGEPQLDVVSVLGHHAAAALERAELVERLRRAEARLQDENHYLRQRVQPTLEMIAESPAMRQVLVELQHAAASDVTVLLQGETGTGKEVAARFVHETSARRERLLVPVNCGALTETLLDSELFGHKKGAFTGAASDRKGVFEVAAGGTVFLDEVGETPQALQVRLLRVLEEGKIKRVGEAIERAVDVRIIAASNRELARMVDEGRFRQDLYYRLRVYPIELPPLRQRSADIEPLCRALVRRHARRMGKRVGPIDPSLIEALGAYRFPGNVRELVNELERAIVRANAGAPLTADLLSKEVLAGRGSRDAGSDRALTLQEQLAQVEREIITRCLERHHGRRVPAAKELGLTRQGLGKKIDRLGITPSPGE